MALSESFVSVRVLNRDVRYLKSRLTQKMLPSNHVTSSNFSLLIYCDLVWSPEWMRTFNFSTFLVPGTLMIKKKSLYLILFSSLDVLVTCLFSLFHCIVALISVVFSETKACFKNKSTWKDETILGHKWNIYLEYTFLQMTLYLILLQLRCSCCSCGEVRTDYK